LQDSLGTDHIEKVSCLVGGILESNENLHSMLIDLILVIFL